MLDIVFSIKNAMLATSVFVFFIILFYRVKFPTWKQFIKIGSIVIIIYFILYFYICYLIKSINL